MTDAISLLTADHREVEGWFSQVEGQGEPDRHIVESIVKALSIHDVIEKEHLYPVTQRRLESGSRLADHSLEEHDQVARALLAVDRAKSGSPELVEELATLIELVRSHVNEEETQIFPALRRALSQPELDELGESLATAKKIAPTRPHPLAPSGALGTMTAGLIAEPLDKARDALEGRS